MVWYSHLFQNFPQFLVIHTVKGFVEPNEIKKIQMKRKKKALIIGLKIKFTDFPHGPVTESPLLTAEDSFNPWSRKPAQALG